MTAYSKYATTVVGSYSVPRWYESLEKEVEAGKLSRADMADAQFRCTQAAVKDQGVAGIALLKGGGHVRADRRTAVRRLRRRGGRGGRGGGQPGGGGPEKNVRPGARVPGQLRRRGGSRRGH